MARIRPKLAVWKFASCDGCQLSLLDCEDELLEIAGEVEIAHFLEATSASVEGPYDLSLVEGSVTTAHDAARIQEVRKQSRFLITIGACATAGGIQALRNFADVREYAAIVYARPDYIQTLATSTADRRSREGRFRTARLSDQHQAARRNDFGAFSPGASRKRRRTASASSARSPAISASWSVTARRVWDPSPMRAAARSVPPTIAAAMAATARWRRRTRRRCRALAGQARHGRRCAEARLSHLQRQCRRLPRGERTS